LSLAYLFLGIAIIAEVIATSALRAAEGFTVLLPSAIAVVGYVVAFYFLSLTLKTMPVGVAYAIWSGVGIVLVSLVALVLYKQVLDLPAMLGMGLIMAGVAVINLFSKTTGH
jgi:small multidrug resistance pump